MDTPVVLEDECIFCHHQFQQQVYNTAIVIKLYREVNYKTYEERDEQVPRCPNCAARQKRIVVFVAAIVGLAFFGAAAVITHKPVFGILFFPFGAIFGGMATYDALGIKWKARGHTSIQNLRNLGWNFGSPPKNE